MQSKPVKTWTKGDYRYNVYHEIDESPDTGYLQQDYKDCTPAERKKYKAQDKKRLEDLYAGVWYYLNVGVEITVKTAQNWAQATRVGRAYLGHIESDSDAGYLQQVEKELVEEAEHDIDLLRTALLDPAEALRFAASLIPCDCKLRPADKKAALITCYGTCTNAKIIAQSVAKKLTAVGG